MLCASCGRNGAKLYKRNVDGKEISLTLCAACYEKLYPEREEESDFFASFVGKGGADARACPVCGTTLEDFRHTGLLGCAFCYTAFREELLPAVRYAQGKVRHEGKAPSGEADEKYDLIRALVHEQERLKLRIRSAEEQGDAGLTKQLKTQLAALNRRLYGGETEE